jgi:hypothetical protein
VIDRGANTVTFYVDGTPIGSTSIASAGAGSFGVSGSMSIMQAISGSVDELTVWNVAQSAPTVLAGMSPPLTSYSDATLIADWQFNEGSGTTTTEAKQGTVATIVSGGTFVPGPP